jgi:hypothetical protein
MRTKEKSGAYALLSERPAALKHLDQSHPDASKARLVKHKVEEESSGDSEEIQHLSMLVNLSDAYESPSRVGW